MLFNACNIMGTFVVQHHLPFTSNHVFLSQDPLSLAFLLFLLLLFTNCCYLMLSADFLLSCTQTELEASR